MSAHMVKARVRRKAFSHLISLKIFLLLLKNSQRTAKGNEIYVYATYVGVGNPDLQQLTHARVVFVAQLTTVR